MDWITILHGMDPLDDHLSLATSYLSLLITHSACFGALHASTSSHDVLSFLALRSSFKYLRFIIHY